MSASEFPLTLLLQVQNDMSSGIQTATQDIEGVGKAADNAANSTGNLQSKVQSTGGSFLKLGLGIASAASGVISLIRQYHNLQRAKDNIQSMTNKEQNATLSLKNAQDNLKKAIKEHGKNSKEAEKAQRALTKAENNAENSSRRLKNAQVALNDRMLDFATSVGPSVAGIGFGLVQTFDILGNRIGGRSGTGGLIGMFARFAGPLIILGGVLLAIKFNLFGFRDAVNGLGVSIGQAVPGLKPFLNFLKNVGIVFGLLPGDVGKAKLLMNSFLGDAIKFGKEAFAKLSKIANLFVSGDISGAINEAKKAFMKLFDLTVGQIKINGFTLTQWVHGLPILIKHLFDKESPMQATIDTLDIVITNFVWPSVTPQAKTGLTKIRNEIQAIFDNPSLAGIASLEFDIGQMFTKSFNKEFKADTPFDKWVKEQTTILDNKLGIMLNDIQLNWKRRQLQWQNFVETNPIMQAITQANILGQIEAGVSNFRVWFDQNIGGPLAQGWLDLGTRTNAFIKTNPIMQKLMVGDIVGAAILSWQEFRTWLGTAIGEPITKAWNDFKTTLETNPAIQAIKNFLSDPLAALKSLFQTAEGAEVGKSELKNILITVDATQALSAISQVQVSLTSMAAVAGAAASLIQGSFSSMVTAIGTAMSNLSKHWGDMAQNMFSSASSATSSIQNSFSSMVTQVGKYMSNLSSHWADMCNNMVAAAKKCASDINKALATIKDKTVTITCKQSGPCSCGKAEGGLMQFGGGGIMSAATGTMFTTNGPQQILVGDNPGGRETVAFIPHNNPGPTLDKLHSMFGNFLNSGISSRTSSSSTRAGPYTINFNPIIYLDGQQIKGKVARMLSENQMSMK